MCRSPSLFTKPVVRLCRWMKPSQSLESKKKKAICESHTIRSSVSKEAQQNTVSIILRDVLEKMRLFAVLVVVVTAARGDVDFTPSPTVTAPPTTAVFSQRVDLSEPTPRVLFATIDAFPGTTSTVKGTIVVEDTSDGISLIGTLVGLEASVTGKSVSVYEGP
jgi:hypothetical protein